MHLSSRPIFTEHCTKGASETFPVHTKAAILNVTKLNLLTQTTLKRRFIAISRLPKSGNSRLDREKFSLLLIGKVLLELILCNGTWPDDG